METPEQSQSEAGERHPASRTRGKDLVLISATAIGIYTCYRLLYYFIPSLAWALALAIVANGMYHRILARLKKPSLAAGFAVMIIGFGIIIPAVFIGQNIANETTRGAVALREHVQSEQWKKSVEEHRYLARAVSRIQRYIDIPALVERATNMIGIALSAIVGGSIWILAQLLIMLFSLFYLFRDQDLIMNKIRSLVPLSGQEINMLFGGVRNTIFATIYGTLTIAILQGTLGGFIFWVLALPAPVLWGLVMGLLALIPVLGAPVIWVPTAIYLALSGSLVKALILTAWGVIVIGVIDNLIYPILVGDKMRMHTLLIFFSVVGGLFLLGSSGLILGPLAVVVTALLLEVWRHRGMEKEVT